MHSIHDVTITCTSMEHFRLDSSHTSVTIHRWIDSAVDRAAQTTMHLDRSTRDVEPLVDTSVDRGRRLVVGGRDVERGSVNSVSGVRVGDVGAGDVSVKVNV